MVGPDHMNVIIPLRRSLGAIRTLSTTHYTEILDIYQNFKDLEWFAEN